VKLGRRFAKDLACRLDAHPTEVNLGKEDELRILSLIDRVKRTSKASAQAMLLVTQAIELHVRSYGSSQALSDALYSLLELGGDDTADTESESNDSRPAPGQRPRGPRPLRVPFRAGINQRVRV
jgi:hypothetical protein